MIFRANTFQPVAGATGTVSRVQLPAAGRVAVLLFEQSTHRALPAAAPPTRHDQQRNALAGQRTQYRAQCRAACMSKANF